MAVPDCTAFCPLGMSVQDRSLAERHHHSREGLPPSQPVLLMLMLADSLHQDPHPGAAEPKYLPVLLAIARHWRVYSPSSTLPSSNQLFQLKRRGQYSQSGHELVNSLECKASPGGSMSHCQDWEQWLRLHLSGSGQSDRSKGTC